MAKKSYAVLETTKGISLVAAADTKADAEHALERVRHQHPASSRFEIVEVPMRGRVSVPNAGDYDEATVARLNRAREKEERRQRQAALARGEEV
jgi:hypothetical protein